MFSAYHAAMRLKLSPTVLNIAALTTLPRFPPLLPTQSLAALGVAAFPPVMRAAMELQRAQEQRDALSRRIMAGIVATASRPTYGPPRLVYSADGDGPERSA